MRTTLLAAATTTLLSSTLALPNLFHGASPTAPPKSLDTAFPVPGHQPLNFCADPKDYILQNVYVDLDPNPPRPGTKLTIRANGTFTEQIDEGATVFLTVKYGLITLIKQEADLCENLPKIDITCPIEKGFMEVSKEVDIPAQVPPGKYTVLADAQTKDKRTVTCMEAQVIFSRNGQ